MALSLCATDSINKLPAGRGTRTPPQARGADLPMISGEKIIGAVGFDFKGSEEIMTTEKRVVLKTIARLGAMAIERMEPK